MAAEEIGLELIFDDSRLNRSPIMPSFATYLPVHMVWDNSQQKTIYTRRLTYVNKQQHLDIISLKLWIS